MDTELWYKNKRKGYIFMIYNFWNLIDIGYLLLSLYILCVCHSINVIVVLKSVSRLIHLIRTS